MYRVALDRIRGRFDSFRPLRGDEADKRWRRGQKLYDPVKLEVHVKGNEYNSGPA